MRFILRLLSDTAGLFKIRTSVHAQIIAGILLDTAAAAQSPSPSISAKLCLEAMQRGFNDGAIIYRAGFCLKAVRDFVDAPNVYREAIN